MYWSQHRLCTTFSIIINIHTCTKFRAELQCSGESVAICRNFVRNCKNEKTNQCYEESVAICRTQIIARMNAILDTKNKNRCADAYRVYKCVCVCNTIQI